MPCHFPFPISIFQLPFSTLHSIFHITTSIFHFTLPFSTLQLPFSTFQPRSHFPLYTSIFHITTSIFHFPTSKQTPWHLQAGCECRPIMCSYGVRGIYGPGGQPTMHSVLIIRHLQSGSWPTDRAFFNFPISNLEQALRHLQARWLTDHAHCKCLIIRTPYTRSVSHPICKTKFMIQLQDYVTSCFTPTEQKIVHGLYIYL